MHLHTMIFAGKKTHESFSEKKKDTSSCECMKVVSDILGELKFVVDIEST